MRMGGRAGVATKVVGIAVVVVVIAIALYGVLVLGPTAATTSSGAPVSMATNSSSVTTSNVSSSTSTANPSSSQAYAYLEATGGCTAGGAVAPCFGGNSSSAYVFDCLSQAGSQGGCTQNVQVTDSNGNFTIYVVYPFSNSTSPAWSNCFWDQRGIQATDSGYGYCSTVGDDSFIIGVPEAPPQAAG